jgi:hypothetical protein
MLELLIVAVRAHSCSRATTRLRCAHQRVPNLALTVRRLHDAGYSGWLVLLGLVPYLGGLILLIFAVLPSSPTGVKYDPVPVAPRYDNPYQPQNSSPPESSYPAQNDYPPQGH